MSKKINIILGEKVKICRKEKKLTREQLAEKIDVSVRFLADVEGGFVGVSLTTLKQLCDELCVSADYLIGNENVESDEYFALESKLHKIPVEKIKSVEKILDEIILITKQTLAKKQEFVFCCYFL